MRWDRAHLSKSDKVITNAHVVGTSQDVGIIFKPSEEGRVPSRADVVRGRVIKVDEVSDLALIQVAQPQNSHKPIQLGDVSEIVVGADVHAIGHPTGEAWTYTKGVISQFRKNYEWSADDNLLHKADVIQTQTPINPGNSGGPLISDAGHLIGINSFKSKGEGLNFAVSVEDVKGFLQSRTSISSNGKSNNCAPKVLYDGRNKQNNARIRLLDSDCSGKADVLVVFPDTANEPVVLMFDSTHSGQPDFWFYDVKRRGTWDYVLISTKHDGKADVIGYDIDEKLRPQRYEAYNGQRPIAAK